MLFHRSILASLLTAVLVPVASFSAFTTEKPPSFDFALNGITYQMSEQTVFEKLGKPQRIGQTTDQCSKATQTRLIYPGTTVDIEEFQAKQRLVARIEVTRRNLGIDRQVKVGDSINKAKKIYKKYIKKDPNKNDTWNAGYAYSEVILVFVVDKAGKITKISLETTC